MLPFEITPATIIISLVILAGIVVAVSRLVRRGTCDCHDNAGSSSSAGCGSCSGCSGCGPIATIPDDREKRAVQAHR